MVGVAYFATRLRQAVMAADGNCSADGRRMATAGEWWDRVAGRSGDGVRRREEKRENNGVSAAVDV